jgi:hypothetical protein
MIFSWQVSIIAFAARMSLFNWFISLANSATTIAYGVYQVIKLLTYDTKLDFTFPGISKYNSLIISSLVSSTEILCFFCI